MGWLATTASATPFIGLFGTVWGVLDAFQGLGLAGGATLRAVAPGIAEALIATAFGLFAAIPALIFFNYFSQRVREFRTRMDDFSLEFFNLAERSYGESDGVLEEQRAAGGFDRRN
jgi:biopolymer transport protein TolQ